MSEKFKAQKCKERRNELQETYIFCRNTQQILKLLEEMEAGEALRLAEDVMHVMMMRLDCEKDIEADMFGDIPI